MFQTVRKGFRPSNTGAFARWFGSLTCKPNYPKTFDKILIANRGEIARRVIRTCKEMGIKTVAVYSDADMNSMFVKEADEAYRLGPPPSNQSYLLMDKILEVVKETGAQAVHPGYGFLSENSEFQKMLQAADVKFIGPPTKAIRAMGDKIESKKLARDAKVSTVPGFLGEVEKDEEIVRISNEIGYPVMIKASAGGGGKGMRIAFNDQEALEGFKLSKEEAISSFGDGRIFIEKYIEDPRHIEFQILGDEAGNYVYLPERECSVQRRNQKVIEEAPSSAITEFMRNKMGMQALQLAGACGYFSTGTVEFLMDKNRKDFYFLEMNTRLQVEHPITEEISGVDLVEQQILIAAGYDLQFKQDDIKINGHSMEYRVYAEDPSRKFLPSIGFLRRYKEPVKHQDADRRVRIDTGVEEGSEISMYYDPMISKLVTWGKTREDAMRILDRSFDEYVIQGLTHNLGFGKSILKNKHFWEGDYSTDFIPNFYPEGYSGDDLKFKDHKLLSVAAHNIKNIHLNQGLDFDNSQSTLFVTVNKLRDQPAVDLQVTKLSETVFEVKDLTNGTSEKVDLTSFDLESNSLVTMDINGAEKLLQFEQVGDDFISYKMYHKGNHINMNVYTPRQFEVKEHMPEPHEIDFAKSVLSPMPGAIVQVFVKAGDKITDGQQLCIIEAMKMQNILKSEVDGIVKKVNVKAGASVAVDELLIEFE